MPPDCVPGAACGRRFRDLAGRAVVAFFGFLRSLVVIFELYLSEYILAIFVSALSDRREQFLGRMGGRLLFAIDTEVGSLHRLNIDTID